MGFPQKEWLVYFYEAKDHHWSLRFFKKNFKHCGVIGYFSEMDTWMLQEYIYGKLMVELLTKKDIESLFQFIKNTNGKIIKVPVKETENHPCQTSLERGSRSIAVPLMFSDYWD